MKPCNNIIETNPIIPIAITVIRLYVLFCLSISFLFFIASMLRINVAVIDKNSTILTRLSTLIFRGSCSGSINTASIYINTLSSKWLTLQRVNEILINHP